MSELRSTRRLDFSHDGHRFIAEEGSLPPSPADAEAQLRWCVTMDGADVLDFHGPYPFRDDDVRTRIIEWYEIQKQRR